MYDLKTNTKWTFNLFCMPENKVQGFSTFLRQWHINADADQCPAPKPIRNAVCVFPQLRIDGAGQSVITQRRTFLCTPAAQTAASLHPPAFRRQSAGRLAHDETRGWTGLHLEMSGNLSFRDEKAAGGDTLVSSQRINKGGGFI